jgi:hypothetical protein
MPDAIPQTSLYAAAESPCSAFWALLQVRMKATRYRMQQWMSAIKS